METQSLYRFAQELLFYSASLAKYSVHLWNQEPQCGWSGTETCDRGTQCIVQTVDIETETDHKSTNRFSVSLLITFPHHVTQLPNIHSVGRWGGGDEVQPSHKMRFTSDQGTYYTGILYMRQQSSSPGHPSAADEA